jgi:hypothetical protein
MHFPFERKGTESLTIHMVRVRKHARLPLVTYLRGGERAFDAQNRSYSKQIV